jgi:TatA/E family protein of Tat protein translocase
MPFNIGPGELIIVLIIALIVVGPGKLPDVGASLGKSIREFRKAATDVQETTKLDAAPAAAPAVATAATVAQAATTPPPTPVIPATAAAATPVAPVAAPAADAQPVQAAPVAVAEPPAAEAQVAPTSADESSTPGA